MGLLLRGKGREQTGIGHRGSALSQTLVRSLGTGITDQERRCCAFGRKEMESMGHQPRRGGTRISTLGLTSCCLLLPLHQAPSPAQCLPSTRHAGIDFCAKDEWHGGQCPVEFLPYTPLGQEPVCRSAPPLGSVLSPAFLPPSSYLPFHLSCLLSPAPQRHLSGSP